jgi:hypothetical protein
MPGDNTVSERKICYSPEIFPGDSLMIFGRPWKKSSSFENYNYLSKDQFMSCGDHTGLFGFVWQQSHYGHWIPVV